MLRIFHLLCHSQALPWEFIVVSLCVASNHSNSFREAKQFSFVAASLPLSSLRAPLPQYERPWFPIRFDQSSLHQCNFLILLVTEVNVSMFHGDGLPTIDRVLAYGNDYFLIPFTFWSVLQSTAAAAKAIRESGMNLNPEVDGTVIRVPVPKWVSMPELLIMQDNTEHCSECPSGGRHAWLLYTPTQLLSKEL